MANTKSIINPMLGTLFIKRKDAAREKQEKKMCFHRGSSPVRLA